MTRRQVVFLSEKTKRYYVSDVYNGDKNEFECKARVFGNSGDSCDKNWGEMMDDVKAVRSLWDFMKLLHVLDGYYHSIVPKAVPGVSLRSVGGLDELDLVDETYLIKEDGTVSVVPELSMCAE